MTKILLTICFVLLMPTMVIAQTISDGDKRSFKDLRPIRIDINGDGKPDAIQPRVYILRGRAKSKGSRRRNIQHWIAFDLITTNGRRISSFFKYQYGTDEADYWVYALVPAGDINGDRKTDLVFYSGDDTSDETVTLINRGNRFVVRARKRSDAAA